MTEPSDEAMNLAGRLRRIEHGSVLQTVWFKLNQSEAAAEIDALAEKRVALAVAKCFMATGPRDGETWSRDALWAAKEIRNRMVESADRPAPEGAAPMRELLTSEQKKNLDEYLARPRCCTPSQEDTGHVSGTKLWLWKNGDHFLAFAHEYPTYGGGDPMVLGEPFGYAILVPSEPRRTEPPNAARGPGSATSSQEDTQPVSGTGWPDPTPEMLRTPEFEAVWRAIKTWDIGVPGVYGGYCGATGNHVRAILDALSPPTDAGGPGSASNTESSRTREEKEAVFQRLHSSPDIIRPEDDWRNFPNRSETVAAAEHDAKAFAAAEREISRLTHENADLRAAMRAAAAPPGLTAGDVERARSIIDDAANIVGGPEAGMLCKGIAVALAAERASARAELLAQIREPSMATWLIGPMSRWGYSTTHILNALADKLTEAK